MAEAAIKVLCADDSADITLLVQLAIDAESDMKCVGCVNDADRIIEGVKDHRPDVVIIDLTMPGSDTLELVRQISAAHPETKCIIYSGYDDPVTMDRAIDSGAWGYVSKHGEMKALIDAVRRVAAGEFSLSRE